MAWDYTLLKKFNATSHFRLLKQLKLELKTQKKINYKNNAN